VRRVVTVPPGIARRSIVVSSIPMVRRKHRRPNSPKNHSASSSGMCWIADQTKVREIRHETSSITGLCRAACLPSGKASGNSGGAPRHFIHLYGIIEAFGHDSSPAQESGFFSFREFDRLFRREDLVGTCV